LNQIEKAYGPNNSILDNCHVRIAFATNDERTAKRISDALGTKTELRSQKNYTGHRLSPWLSHMMVSRQETQRALMTPGEVMQMPQSNEVIMISGAPPILAKKLRYFKDRNFTERVTEPPLVSGLVPGSTSDWGGDGSDKQDSREFALALPDEGGRDLQPELTPDVIAYGQDEDPEMAPEHDDGIDPLQLNPHPGPRRAAALDKADDRLLPGF
ncbi:MAG TPA: conjugal transfer protein TraG, partial [Hyphomonas sp.]|nr:conjugal transfer protein TraG [Hyphomonas sp.]